MEKRGDQVFQLSLTEIAFMVAFLLLLLLGFLVFNEQDQRRKAEEELRAVTSMEHAITALNDAKRELTSALHSAGAPNPDEVITKLIAADELRAERDKLRQRVNDLDGKLTALTELRAQLEHTLDATKSDVTRNEVESALALQSQLRRLVGDESGGVERDEERTRALVSHVRQALTAASEFAQQLKEQLGKNVVAGQEREAIREVVAAAKRFGEITKSGYKPDTMKRENADLRGQIAYLKGKLEARGGRDYPPCWADESTGKVQFLFAVELRPDVVAVSPAWPTARESDARSLPGIDDVLTKSPLSYSDFRTQVNGIFRQSEAQQCRHFVLLKNIIPDAVHSDRARLMVEDYFYKVEVRR